jgi:hypothetical protein
VQWIKNLCTTGRTKTNDAQIQRAKDAKEQMDVLFLIMTQTSTFKRLWDSEHGVTLNDKITRTALCNSCKGVYNSYISSMLKCYMDRCHGDIDRMKIYHTDRVKVETGKFESGIFKNVCSHGRINEAGDEIVGE